ncbi:MAG: DMT family transporter [Verrucomicrobiota bacterium]
MTSSRLSPLAFGSVILCILIWAGQSVAVKSSLEGLPPFLVILCRFSLSLPLLYLFSRIQGAVLAVPKGSRWFVALNSAFLSLQIALFTLGTDRSTSINSIILIHTFPFFSALLAPVLLPDERWRLMSLLGILVAFLAVPVLIAPTERISSGPFAIGDLMLVGAAFIMGAKIVLMKRLLRESSAVQLTFWDSLLAVLLFGMLTFFFERDTPLTWTAESLSGLLYQGIVVSTVGFLLWLSLLKRYSPNRLNIFRLLTPAVGVFLGNLLLQEALDARIFLSLLLVCLGLFLVHLDSQKKIDTSAASSPTSGD